MCTDTHISPLNGQFAGLRKLTGGSLKSYKIFREYRTSYRSDAISNTKPTEMKAPRRNKNICILHDWY